MSAPVAVMSAVSGAYSMALAVTLGSLLESARPGLRFAFYVLDDGVPGIDRDRLERLVSAKGASLTWIRPEREAVQGLPIRRGASLSTYYRLWLGESLPRSLARVIWLDADLLVLGDIGELAALDCDACHVMAVRDMAVPCVSSPLGVGQWRALGLPPESPYFNAGVMVINLDRWRQDQIGAQALEYIRKHRPSVALFDQEGLNAVLAGRWTALDDRWNCIASVSGRVFHESARVSGAAAGEPCIYHFAGDWKPWTLPYGRHPYDLYYRRLDQTPWAGWRPRRTVAGLGRAFYHETLRDRLYPLERVYTNLRFGRLRRGGATAASPRRAR